MRASGRRRVGLVPGRWVLVAACVCAVWYAHGSTSAAGGAPLARVIGGGPAACAAAIVLRNAGWAVEQYFPALEPRHHLAVVGLNAARWIASQGIAAQASGPVLQAVRERGVFDGGRLRRAPIYESPTGRAPRWPWNWIGRSTHLVPIGALEWALRGRAQALGVELFPGARALDVHAVGGGSQLRFTGTSGGEARTTGAPAQLVVDASGLGSSVSWNGQLPERRVAAQDAALSSWMSVVPLAAGASATGASAALPELLLFRVPDPAARFTAVVGGVQSYRDGSRQLSLEHADRLRSPTNAERNALLTHVATQLGLNAATLELDSAATFRAGLSRVARYWNGDASAPVVCLGDGAIEPHLRSGSGVSSSLAAAALLLPLAGGLQRGLRDMDTDTAAAALRAFAGQMAVLANAQAEVARALLVDHELWLNSFVPPSHGASGR